MLEKPLFIPRTDYQMLAIYHPPTQPAPFKLGVLMLVGGGQYRVGSHRLYVQLARFLARKGWPVLRFDVSGMGDSGGENRGFQHHQQDIKAALEKLLRLGNNLDGVAIWGLCDGASAALLYAMDDPRVKRVILVNPWIDDQAGEARALLKHYYWQRLFSRSFWQKMLRGQFALRQSLRSLFGNLQRGRQHPSSPDNLQQALMRAFDNEQCAISMLLSANDITAQTFSDWYLHHASGKVDIHSIAEADHTFSRRPWLHKLMQLTAAALQKG